MSLLSLAHMQCRTYLLLDLDLLVVFAGGRFSVSAQAAEPGGPAANRVRTAHLMDEAVEVLQLRLLGKNVAATGTNVLPLIFQHLGNLKEQKKKCTV